MNNPLLALAAILFLMSAIGYLQKYPLPVSEIKPILAKLQHWLRNDDPEIKIPVMLIGGLLAACVASWLFS